MSQPDFWADSPRAQGKVSQLKTLKAVVSPYQDLVKSLDDLKGLNELVQTEPDEEILREIKQEVTIFQHKLEHLENQSYLRGKHDAGNVFLSIHAGAGGTDACDWAQMLLRMYLKWLGDNDYESRIVDSLASEEAGIRYATVYVQGLYAFGFLKSEIGVHRLVRISPFDTNKKRHTSFAAVSVVPELTDVKVEIEDTDLKIDTFRAGGPGGQHVNVTDSAVRITHLPTGVVVQCQSERSQHINRETALKLLASRLYILKQKEKEDELKKMFGSKGEIAWGNQIRSYVLQPYTLVKDHRTGTETHNVNGVLDGKIDIFIDTYLRSRYKKKK